MKENLKTLSSSDKMTNEISALSLVESFLDEYYLFRRNVLSGKPSISLSQRMRTKLRRP